MCSVCKKEQIYYSFRHTVDTCPCVLSAYCSFCGITGHATTQCPHGVCSGTVIDDTSKGKGKKKGKDTILLENPVIEVRFHADIKEQKKIIDGLILAYGEKHIGGCLRTSLQKLLNIFKDKEWLISLFGTDSASLVFIDPIVGLSGKYEVLLDASKKRKTKKKALVA